METNRISFRDTLAIGLMLFSLFFGAGNLIFPPALGQAAGENLWPAISGFLITGVGLPLLGVLAIGLSGSSDASALARRVHPVFAAILMVSTYLTIGPLFAIPRTGAVSYEVGIKPFLSGDPGSQGVGLFIYTIIFFAVTCWLALNPNKIVDRVGKVLTPALLVMLAFLVGKSFIQPLGVPQAPSGEYQAAAFFKGFQEGYLTMDTLASVVFGIIVINAVKSKGVTKPREIAKVCTGAGLIAVFLLGAIYVSLAYLGATSVSVIGKAANGGIILSQAANIYYGSLGNVVLGLAILFACLTTSIGLVSSCAAFFAELFPKFSYRTLVFMLSGFSLLVANVGLTQLISFSVPVLVAIYPLVIVLILLTFLAPVFNGLTEVYRYSLLFTALVSIVDGLQAAGLPLGAAGKLVSYIPLFNLSLGWLLPAILGAGLGYVKGRFLADKSNYEDIPFDGESQEI